MTENKRYYIGNGENCTICDSNQGGSDFYNMLTQFEAVDRLNEQEERIQELETELSNMTQRFEYELQMKLKYHSKLIESEKR